MYFKPATFYWKCKNQAGRVSDTIAHTDVYIIWLSRIMALRIPDKGYSRDASCGLSMVSIFLLGVRCLSLFHLFSDWILGTVLTYGIFIRDVNGC